MKEQNHIPDPFSFYKEYSKMAEDSWAKVIEKNLATDFFAATMGKQLEGHLVFLDMFKKNAKSYFETLPIPSEQDFHRLAGQIIALEDKIDFLDDGITVLDEKLETILKHLSGLSENQDKPGKLQRRKKTEEASRPGED